MWLCDLGWVICENMMGREGKTFPLWTPELRQRQKKNLCWEIWNVFHSDFIQFSRRASEGPRASQAVHFFPSDQFYSSFISSGLEEQIWIVAAVVWMKAANGGCQPTLDPDEQFDVWIRFLTLPMAWAGLGRLGQIATVEHNGGVPLQPVTGQFWNCQVAMQSHQLCGQFCHLSAIPR